MNYSIKQALNALGEVDLANWNWWNWRLFCRYSATYINVVGGRGTGGGRACQQYSTVHVRSLGPPAMSTACVSTFTIWLRNSLVVSVGSVLTAQERHSMRL